MDPVAASDDRVERRIVVIGHVQGVGYRWFARETARALGVSGWTRNMPDGSVVLEVRASPAIIARFVAELEVGPPSADVTEVLVTERADSAPLSEHFVVMR